MAEKFSAKKDIVIQVPPAKVWEALTNPALVKQYFFGVDVTSNWKVGSPIVYKGTWEGKEFIDKGNVLKAEPGKYLLCNYWSGFSGLPDVPENYQHVAYELTPVEGGTRLAITQDNIPTKESAQHSGENWGMVLNKMKELLEK